MWNISEMVLNHVLLSSLLVVIFVLAFLSAKRPHSNFIVTGIEVVDM